MTEPTRQTEPTRKAGRARGAVVIGARIVAGTVGTVVAVAAIAAAAWLPLPSHHATPASDTVTPVPAAQQRVCAGPLLRLGNDAGESATAASSIGQPGVRFGQTEGRAVSTEMSSTDNTLGLAPELLTLPPVSGAGGLPILGGSQSELAGSGDIVGLASAECSEGSGDSWLVGGATDTGRTTLVTLSNPSNVNATVSLSVFAESGAIAAAGTDGIVVPPGGQRVYSLAAFAPGVQSPVVRVQSSGGQIVANLQQSTVRTLEPGGVDIVGTSTGPSKTNLIPGLVVVNSAATTARQAEPGFSDLRSVIRLFVPGTQQAQVELSITPESSDDPALAASVPAVAAADVLVTLEPGKVQDVPLDSLPDGNYTVSAASDRPIVASARLSTVGTTGASDFVWLPAAASIASRSLVAIAPGPSPLLHLANPTRKAETVTIVSSTGAKKTVAVPAGKTVTSAAESSARYTLSGFARLAMTVSYAGDGTLSSFAARPSAPASRPITIYP